MYGFFQRGPKRRHELVGQVAYETDRVRQDDIAGLAQIDASRRGIQRGEQLIRGIRLRLGQRIEQRRLACVGVPHQRYGIGFATLTLTTLRAVLATQLFQP